MSDAVTFNYGALSDTLEEQANKQGYTLGKKAKVLQDLNHSMLMCWIHGLCTDSQEESMNKKLHKQVIAALMPLEMGE